MNKLYAIQDVFISVQSALDEAASYGERIKKWVSPSEGPLDATDQSPVNTLFVPAQHRQLDGAVPQLVGDHRPVLGHSPALPHTASIPGAGVG